METLAFLALCAIGFLFGVPIYLLVRVAALGRTVEDLERRLARLLPKAAEGPPAEQAALPRSEPLLAEQLAPAEQVAPAGPPPSARPAEAAAQAATAPAGPALPPIMPPTEVEHAARPADLESLLAKKWLARLGIAALAIAAAFFLKYAFDSQWVSPHARVGIGLAAAGALLAAGQTLLGRPKYRDYAQVLSSGGIIIFFLAIYAAFRLYHLIGFAQAFGALAVGALAASLLAVANNTQAVALLCLAGAFATPVLLHTEGGGTGDLVRFYLYLCALNVWSAVLVRVRPWPWVLALAFGATWLLFLGSEPREGVGVLAGELFALVFLGFAIYGGTAGVRREEGAAAGEGGPATLSLVVLGCVLFGIASAILLAGAEVLGLPALAPIGLLLALVLVGTAAALQAEAAVDRGFIALLRYLAAAAVFLLAALTVPYGQPIPSAQALIAFAFTVFVYLLFLAVATHLRGQEGGDGPAALLVGATALVHAESALRALAPLSVWGMRAAVAWLPLAGGIAFGFIWVWRRGGERAPVHGTVTLLSAQALPLVALLEAVRWVLPAQRPAAGMALLLAEFVLISSLWTAGRRAARLPGFRGDLLGAFANAAIFFGLMAAEIGLAAHQGFVLLCGAALALAAYHALVGGEVLRREDDLLLRYVHLGLALTFLTIAIPIQLRAAYLTLAWAAESVALIWTGLRMTEQRVRAYGAALLGVTAVKALFWDLAPYPPPVRLLLNPRMLSGLTVVAALYVSAALLWRAREGLDSRERHLPAAFAVAANVFTLLFASWDLWDHVGRAGPMTGSAQQLALSIFWSVYALAAMLVGIWRRHRPVRLFALGLLYLSIAKVFLLDLSFLQQLYRIISLLGLGVVLLLVSLIYLRFEERLR